SRSRRLLLFCWQDLSQYCRTYIPGLSAHQVRKAGISDGNGYHICRNVRCGQGDRDRERGRVGRPVILIFLGGKMPLVKYNGTGDLIDQVSGSQMNWNPGQVRDVSVEIGSALTASNTSFIYEIPGVLDSNGEVVPIP